MIWLWASVLSAFLLGLYDVAKKKAVSANDGIQVLLVSTAISSLIFLPLIFSSLFGWGLGEGTLLEIPCGSVGDHIFLFFKSLIVAGSWFCGILALKHLPLTTVGIVKASRPVFVLLGCLVIFSERLNMFQWGGILIAIISLTLLGFSSKNEGISFVHNRWAYCLFGSVLLGVASALLDKLFMRNHEPVFVQAWCNIYITLIFGIIYLLAGLRAKSKFKWDWSILLISIFLTSSDFLYFYSLSCDGSLLSVVSMLRRSSVVVTFIIGAIFFNEKNIRAKGLEMILLLSGMALLLFGSYM